MKEKQKQTNNKTKKKNNNKQQSKWQGRLNPPKLRKKQGEV